MIYLLGIQHYIQYMPDGFRPHFTSKTKRFYNYAYEVSLSKNIAVIAEETNEEIDDGRISIVRLIAEGMHPPLRYIPCEPNSMERRKIGIPTGDEILDLCPPGYTGNALEKCRDFELQKYFPMREKFWMERIRSIGVNPILFVCGADHIQTFSRRLSDCGFLCKIVSLNWCESDETEFGVIPLEERPI